MEAALRRLGLFTAMTVAVATWAGTAGGQTPAPAKPVACLPAVIEDPAGDATDVQGIGPGATNLDILDAFVLSDGADKPVTVNMSIANLDRSAPPGATTPVWNFDWVFDGTSYYIAVTSFGGGDPTFTFGQRVDAVATTVSQPIGETTGTLYEGEKGVVQVVIPPDAGGKVGSKLDGLLVRTGRGEIIPGVGRGLQFFQDTAPDAGEGPDVVLEACPPPELPVTAAAKAGSAKKAAKRKRVKLFLQATAPVTGLTAKLVKSGQGEGGAALGQATVERAEGTVKLTLKLARKPKVKKGAYDLMLEGTLADGRKAKKTVTLTFGK